MNQLLIKAREICKDVLTLENLPSVVKYAGNLICLNNVSLTEKDLFLKEIEMAKLEWLLAKANFEQVGDPDLVDQAVLAMAATEKKYVYLLKEAQKKNIISDYLYTSFGEYKSQI